VQNIDDVLQGFVVRTLFDNVLDYREFEIFKNSWTEGAALMLSTLF